MHSITSLISHIKSDYPQISFKPGKAFYWSSPDNVIHYDKSARDKTALLLHELSHALLGHADYTRDIQLLAMERRAWDYAIELAKSYHQTVSDHIVQSHLDSYRDWLHARSTCPDCQATGLQNSRNAYRCLACNRQWRVNNAKMCALRRYKTKKIWHSLTKNLKPTKKIKTHI